MQMSTKMIKSIRATEYYHNRGCGCCTDWGTRGVIVDQDGVEHEFDCPSLEAAIERFLGEENYSLGYDTDHEDDPDAEDYDD